MKLNPEDDALPVGDVGSVGGGGGGVGCSMAKFSLPSTVVGLVTPPPAISVVVDPTTVTFPNNPPAGAGVGVGTAPSSKSVSTISVGGGTGGDAWGGMAGMALVDSPALTFIPPNIPPPP